MLESDKKMLPPLNNAVLYANVVPLTTTIVDADEMYIAPPEYARFRLKLESVIIIYVD